MSRCFKSDRDLVLSRDAIQLFGPGQLEQVMPNLLMFKNRCLLIIYLLVAATVPPAQILAQSDTSVIPASLPGADERQLEFSVNSARQLESTGDYVGAQRLWNQIAEGLEHRFGEDSWQAVNARLEAQTAGRQSTFNPTQRETVSQIRQLQSAAAAAAEKQDWQAVADLIQSAYDQTAGLFGESSHEAARIKTSMAQMAHAGGDPQRAWQLYREALATLREIVGVNHPEIEALNYSIGNLLQISNEHEKAIPWLSQSVAISKQLYGEQSPVYADRMTALGVTMHQVGNYDEAISWLAAGDAIQQTTLGAEHPRRARTLMDLGIACLAARRLDEGRHWLTMASDILAARLGDRHPDTLNARTHLATALVLAGETDLAATTLRAVLQAQTSGPHPDPVASAATCFKLAVLVGRQEKLDESEKLLRRAIEIQSQHLGANHELTAQSASALILLLEKSGRNSEAGQLRQQFTRTARQSGPATRQR